MTATFDHPPQTTAQWAVRWHGLVMGAVLLACVPLLHLLWHGVLDHEEPPLRTRGQVPAPPLVREKVFDGSWMLAQERHLREASPVVWWLRSSWNELRYRAGVPDSQRVHVGKHEWFFVTQEVFPDRAAFDRAAPARRQFLRDVRDLVKRAGAELFVMAVPDKARVYPEFAYADGLLPPAKAGNYAAILAELAAEGIPTVDIAAALLAVRAAEPARELYFERDTHWKPQGALVGSQAAALAIEEHFGNVLSRRRTMEIASLTSVHVLGELPANLGLATIERLDPLLGEMRPVPMSLLSQRLAEKRDYYGVSARVGALAVPMYGDDPEAEILLIGTGFAEANGASALTLCLGRPVRTVIKRGAEGLLPLRLAVPELQQGTRAKVVVWELVERGLFEGEWLSPKPLLPAGD